MFAVEQDSNNRKKQSVRTDDLAKTRNGIKVYYSLFFIVYKQDYKVMRCREKVVVIMAYDTQ